MIYLFTSDGHRDSVDLSHYATTEQELIQFTQQYFERYFSDLVITNCEVDFNKKLLKLGIMTRILKIFLTIPNSISCKYQKYDNKRN